MQSEVRRECVTFNNNMVSLLNVLKILLYTGSQMGIDLRLTEHQVGT